MEVTIKRRFSPADPMNNLVTVDVGIFDGPHVREYSVSRLLDGTGDVEKLIAEIVDRAYRLGQESR